MLPEDDVFSKGTGSAPALGMKVLHAARRVVLHQLMRPDPKETFFNYSTNRMRQTDIIDPISKEFVGGLKQLSAADYLDDAEWRFAPVGVLSHLERDTINVRQIYAFAKAFNLPLIRWKLEMVGSMADEAKLAGLYEHEGTLWAYYVVGAPVLLTSTIKATRKLVNGAQGLLHSLSFVGGIVLEEVADAISGGFWEITLDAAPLSVNVTVGGTEEHPRFWHGTAMEDLSKLLVDVGNPATPG